MSGTFKGLTQAQIDRRLKEGRGQGQGRDYKPFIYTRDVSSLGRSHRLPGSKTRRLHHLLSDLELAIFLTLDRSPQVTDIREQFPMRAEDTVRIAEELGLAHGRYKGIPQVLTSDFLVDFDDPSAHPSRSRPSTVPICRSRKSSRDLNLKGATGRKKGFPGSSSRSARYPERHLPISNGSIRPMLKTTLHRMISHTISSCFCSSFSVTQTGS